jgi:hypothetical protein
MAKETGKEWKYYLNTGTEGSPTWTVVLNQRDGSFNIQQNTIDTTTKSDGGWTTQTASTRDGAASFSIVYDSTDATHTALLAAALNQTLKHFKLVGEGGENWIFHAWVSMNLPAPVDNVVEVAVDLVRSDAPVYSAS